jgi:hypothetical protein
MEKLLQLQDELMNEQKILENRLKKIEEELSAISNVLNIIEKRNKSKTTDTQMTLITDAVSKEYSNMTFQQATLDLLSKFPEKWWEPKEINRTLLAKGFSSKSKNFGNITRTMLAKFREEGIVNSEKHTKGKQEMWRYKHKIRRIRLRKPLEL